MGNTFSERQPGSAPARRGVPMLAFDVYHHWETDLRPFTVSALRRLTPEQLAYKPAGWHSSAWDLAVHLVDCEWHWIYRNALKRDHWEARWDASQFVDMDQLLQYWAKIHKVSIEWLQESPITELSRKYPMPYIEFPAATMNWLVYHVMEHEAHHRGQIFMLMRMQGLQPPEI
jgi:uncharacterized damage-inducible protein DinB